MKKLFLIIILFLVLIPTFVLAKYNPTNLDEALNEEVIIHDFSNYKETNDQVIIYLFRGNGCQFCRSFLTFLNSIVNDYGKYFKVESYEVWNNKENKNLLKDVANHLGYTDYNLPFIIIGDKVFTTYNEARNEEIINTIIKEYQNDDKYDVLVDMGIKKKPFKINYQVLIDIMILISFGGVLIIEINNFKDKKRINSRLDDLEKLIRKKEGK